MRSQATPDVNNLVFCDTRIVYSNYQQSLRKISMSKFSKTPSTKHQKTREPVTRWQLTREQLLVGFIVTLLAGILMTIIVMLSIQKKQVAVANNANLYPASLAVETLYIAIDPETANLELDKFGHPKPVLEGINLKVHESSYKSETIDILLESDGRLEYKASMNVGEVLLYNWKSDGDVRFDFHANQVGDDSGFWTSYSEGEGSKEQGSIVALYTGQHGWFWRNLEDRPVKIKLVVAGYYNEWVKIDLNKKED
jgi:hypothetical protein